MSCAKSVLPAYMAVSTRKPARLPCHSLQVDTAHLPPQTQSISRSPRHDPSVNRTALVSQKVELSFRHFADARLLLVHRQLQLAHNLPQSLQGFFGLAPSAQDHEVVGVGHEPRAEGSLEPEHLPSQHEPA